MPVTTPAYAAALDIQHYIVPMRLSSVALEDAATAAANNGAALAAWLDVTKAKSGPMAVEFSGFNTTFELLVNTATRTVTNAVLASGTATLTLTAAAGVLVGERIKVTDLPSPFASLNTTSAVVTGVTTTSPFTVSYAVAGSPISSASVAAGTVTTGVYPLDGTGAPIQLTNITGAPIATNTNTESIITHDQVTRGSAITIGLSDTSTIAAKGMTVHKSVDHKVLEAMRQVGTAEQLAVKYLRVGPGGTVEKKLCYGQITSKQEEGDAGALVKFSATMNVLGQVYTIFDNT